MSLLGNIGVGKTKLIRNWLENNTEMSDSYVINPDYTIDVNLSVHIKRHVMEIPDYIQFGKVRAGFIISGTHLSSLKGSPSICYSFVCNNCPNLKSLEGGPNIQQFIQCDERFSMSYIKSIYGDEVEIIY